MTDYSMNAKAKVIAKAWKDPKFKEKLFKDPHAAFAEFGFTLHKDLNVIVKEPQANELLLLLRATPADVENMSERELHIAASNFGYGDSDCQMQNPSFCQTVKIC